MLPFLLKSAEKNRYQNEVITRERPLSLMYIRIFLAKYK